ncbi:hypothetical protein DAEQUDRAFT_495289 [Daedalea quercina L-15889]|uniref:Uncharacterized protein n=1 Tax=Daedalea quercina L-15889 TaxID=1314783 RepID=A0A165MK92_9APHY|nr:hypothetical protein DAEQUDRAFT_495289 [Daedalea quercina L-15889]
MVQLQTNPGSRCVSSRHRARIPAKHPLNVILPMEGTLTRASQAVPAFEDVIILQEPTSDQLFFVNFVLLEDRSAHTLCSEDCPQRHCDTEPWPTFVHLLEVPTLMGTPTQIVSILRELCARGKKCAGLPRPLALTITERQPLDITVSIPLAAVLLEYPVAYVPANADQTAFLAGVRLDVYDFALSLSGNPDRHDAEGGSGDACTIFKFSCPSHLAGEDAALLPARVLERMQSRLGARLNAAGCQCGLVVRHTTETHDRLSL